MLFSVGTRVKFLHTKDEGVVTALLDNDMVSVLLDEDDIEIPAFVDDLIRYEDFIDQHPSVKAKIVPGKKDKEVKPPERPPIETQYNILKSVGIQLAFDPVMNKEGNAEKYEIYLINDTKGDTLFKLTLTLKGRIILNKNGKLGRISVFYLGDLLFDQLNDSPVFDVECWRIKTDGTGPRLHKTLKIKPKQFFKRVKTAPLLNKKVHLFKVFDQLKPTSEKKGEDLRAYTQKNTAPARLWQNLHERMPHEVMDYASFVPEIDLHIEKLVENHQKMDASQILHIQLQHFERFIDKAIHLGAKRVFIIHGLGKGRLRDAIATQLIRMEAVKSFKNEFHHRYGFGATEVILE